MSTVWLGNEIANTDGSRRTFEAIEQPSALVFAPTANSGGSSVVSPVASVVGQTGVVTGSQIAADPALSATFVAFPAGGLADYAVLAKLTAGTNNVQWTTKEELVARALAWTIATDARYGVKGDGSTVDTTAAQAAMTATPAGGCTFFPPGLTCIIDASLLPTPGSRISAYGTTFKTKLGIAGINIFQPTDGCEIRGATIDPNKANTTNPGSDTGGIGVYFYNATGFSYPVRLIDVTVKAGWQLGYRVATGQFNVDPASNPLSDVLIQNVNVDSQAGRAARLLNLNGLRIVGGRYTNSGTDGIHISSCADTIVTDAECISNGGHGLVTTYVARFTAKGVIARLNGNGGIVMGGGAAITSNLPSYDWTIVGCTTDYNGQASAWAGIDIDPTVTGSPTVSQTSPGSISDCVSAHNSGHGVYVNNAGFVSVIGVTAHDNGNSGILTSTADGLVDGCLSYNNAQYGIYIAGTASGTRNRMSVGINYVTGNTLGQYNIDDPAMDIRWARADKAPLVKTANYNITLVDFNTEFNGTNLTASLPDPTTLPAGSASYLVKNVNTSALTLNSLGSSRTIDGQASLLIYQNGSIRVYTDGTQWLSESSGLAPFGPTLTGPVTLAGATTSLTVGTNSGTSDATIALKAPSGKTNSVQFNRAGSASWWLYDANSANLVVRDMVNGVQMLTFNPGSGTTGAAVFAGQVSAGGSFQPNAAKTTLNGTTVGTAIWAQPFTGSAFKKVIVNLQGYENTTATAQTITFPTAFTQTPYLAHDDSGGATVSTSTLTLPASMGATKTGWIVVEGY